MSSLCLSLPSAGEHLPGSCILEPALAYWPNICTEQLPLGNVLQHQLTAPNITRGPQNLACKALEASERLLKDVCQVHSDAITVRSPFSVMEPTGAQLEAL